MKLAYDGSSIHPEQTGVGHYTAALLEALQAGYPETEMMVLSHRGRYGPGGATQKRSFPVKEIWMQLWVPAILSRHSPDICHFTNGIAPISIHTPYVVTLHDLSLIQHPEWHPGVRRIWMRRLLKPSVSRAAGVICDSEKTRSDLLEWMPFDPSRTTVVSLAARSTFFSPCAESEKNSMRRRYGLEQPFLLYVGNIEPRKNLSRIMDAFCLLRRNGLELVLAGRRAWLCADILRQAARHQDRVRILNYVREEDLPALYQSAVALVYPSLLEGFGLPVLEAMASGTAVLVSDVEPLSSLVGNAGWRVPPEDTAAWKAALQEVICNSEKRESFESRGRRRAAEFSWERTARETMDFYRCVLGKVS